MVYNQFLYNTSLYNAGRSEVGGIIKSIIQAHTGPHIQAVVGQTPLPGTSEAGISFISDFIITEGSIKKPPTSFKFPDLSAILRAVRTGQDDIITFIKGVLAKDLSSSIFLVDRIPDVPASIFGLFQKDLSAFLLGKLAEKDLGAFIFVLIQNLKGFMQGIPAPNLEGKIFTQSPGNLRAKIHAPLDLAAVMGIVFRKDLPTNIFAFQTHIVSGFMFGQPARVFNALIKGVSSIFSDLSSISFARDETSISAIVTAKIPGPNDFLGIIFPSGKILSAAIRPSNIPGIPVNLGGTIQHFEFNDLGVIINFFGAKNIKGIIGSFPLGSNDLFLSVTLQPVHPTDLLANIFSNNKLKNLTASIEALRDTTDINAFLRVSETFVTTILTVTTLISRSLRATIGNPDCKGGVGTSSFFSSLLIQQAKNLSGFIESFLTTNLSAKINTGNIIQVLDSIDILYSRKRVRNIMFLASDTIDVFYTRFIGKNLSAIIKAISSNKDLGASLVSAFPLLSFTPTISSLLTADLRFGEQLDVKEIKLQLEGTLLEYIYVNGTDLAFIKDANEVWKINIRSFREIANNLFGDFAAGRICRLANVASFSTMDEAVRACIAVVIGLDGESNISAQIQAVGQIHNMLAVVKISSLFVEMSAIIKRVFPVNLSTFIVPIDAGVLQVKIKGIGFAAGSATNNLNAFISQLSQDNLLMSISPSGGIPFQPNVINAVLLSANISKPTLVNNISANIIAIP